MIAENSHTDNDDSYETSQMIFFVEEFLYRRSFFCNLLLLQSLLILKIFCARPCKIRNF